MPVGKIHKGKYIAKAVKYDLQEKKHAEIIGGTVAGRTADEIISELQYWADKNTRVKRDTFHTSISFHANDQKIATNSVMADISSRYMERMGYTQHAYVVTRHNDTEHPHMHILASRVGYDGKCHKDSFDYARSEEICREIGAEYGLTYVPPSREVKQETAKREIDLKAEISSALQGNPTATAFVQRLKAAGIGVAVNIQSTGRVSGISYTVGDKTIKGSELGREYGWGGLQAKGVTYERGRDEENLRRGSEGPQNDSKHSPRVGGSHGEPNGRDSFANPSIQATPGVPGIRNTKPIGSDKTIQRSDDLHAEEYRDDVRGHQETGIVGGKETSMVGSVPADVGNGDSDIDLNFLHGIRADSAIRKAKLRGAADAEEARQNNELTRKLRVPESEPIRQRVSESVRNNPAPRPVIEKSKNADLEI